MRYLLAAILALVLAGRASAAELLIDLRTDYIPVLEFASVRTTLARPDGSEMQTTVVTVSRDTDALGGFRIVEFLGIGSGLWVVSATLLDAGGFLVEERSVRLTIRETYTLTVLIAKPRIEIEVSKTDELVLDWEEDGLATAGDHLRYRGGHYE